MSISVDGVTYAPVPAPRDELEASAFAAAAVVAVITDERKWPVLADAWVKMDDDHRAQFTAAVALNIHGELHR